MIYPTVLLSSILFKPHVQQRFGRRRKKKKTASLFYLTINSRRMKAAKIKVSIFSVEAVKKTGVEEATKGKAGSLKNRPGTVVTQLVWACLKLSVFSKVFHFVLFIK